MKNILIIIAVAAMTMCACSDDNGSNNGKKNETDNEKKNTQIKNGDAYIYADNDTTYMWLGAGYDVTDTYLKGVREQIINLDAIEHGYTSHFASLSYADVNIKFYGSAKELLKDLTARCEINVPDNSALLFTGTVLDCPFISAITDYSSDYGFIFTLMNYETTNIKRMILPKSPVNKYDKYLTDEFKQAVETESADKVVERFGTHVLTDVTIGRCVTTLFSSRNIDYKTLYSGMYNRYTATINANNNYEVDINNPDGRLLVWLNGGDKQRLPLDWKNGSVRMKGCSKAKITYDDWTLNANNGALVNFDGTKMIPIYELVNNENKRQELKEAVAERISSRQLK